MEEKDELLEAFENPDMADNKEEVESETIMPEDLLVSEQSNTTPVETVEEKNESEEVSVIDSTEQVNAEEVEQVDSTEQVTTEEVEQFDKTETEVEEKPLETKEVAKSKVSDEDTNFVKKNFTFLLILCAIIAVFIIFLPKILSILSGGKY